VKETEKESILGTGECQNAEKLTNVRREGVQVTQDKLAISQTESGSHLKGQNYSDQARHHKRKVEKGGVVPAGVLQVREEKGPKLLETTG